MGIEKTQLSPLRISQDTRSRGICQDASYLLSRGEVAGLYRGGSIVEKESENLLKVIVPVDELASLAKETFVLSIRLPDRPVVQGDK
jgi:hypothetical protein